MRDRRMVQQKLWSVIAGHVAPRSLFGIAMFVVVGCSSAGIVAPPPVPVTPAPSPTAPAVREAPLNWQLLDPTTDNYPGISADRAMRELLAGKQPRRTVIVAVIDGGVDTSHVDLRANLWTNPGETASNSQDDDKNGYVDDVRGWDFIGGTPSSDVRYDTYELARLVGSCKGTAAGAGTPAPDSQTCSTLSADLTSRQAAAQQTFTQVEAAKAALAKAIATLKLALGGKAVTVANVTALSPSSSDIASARTLYISLAARGIDDASIAEAEASLRSELDYGLNLDFNPRPMVGDNYSDPSEHYYGNADVMGPDALHGTHVAGIIGAVRGNGIGIDGIAPAVRIMSVRTVPDGDERDKDVANAIRYAVDNGANVINMSFGKGYSPFKSVVDDAVRYADAHGVLLVHAAGNDGADLAQSSNFPNRTYASGGIAANWIEVGASSWRGGDTLAVSFSNYGQQQVDVFAPGEDIYSTVPGGYQRLSGTSMAAPVVSGLAALIMAYYPDLKAADVKRIIMASVTSYKDRTALRPGSAGGTVSFGALSVTGGIVNAYNAIKMAGGGG
ncbi:MAG: S8 family peptidase [Gemmatimonadaceae bacterium]